MYICITGTKQLNHNITLMILMIQWRNKIHFCRHLNFSDTGFQKSL